MIVSARGLRLDILIQSSRALFISDASYNIHSYTSCPLLAIPRPSSGAKARLLDSPSRVATHWSLASGARPNTTSATLGQLADLSPDMP